MELLFGCRVRIGGRGAGYLAGVEVDPGSRRVTKIIFSEDGKLGPHAHTRAIDAVRIDDGKIVVGETSPSPPSAGEHALWSRAIRVRRGGRSAGHLTGVVTGAQGAVDSILGRHHWWTPRYRVPTADLDLSIPGELRARNTSARAA